MSLFLRLFLQCAGLMIGITAVAQVIGAIFIKNGKDDIES